MDTATAAPSSNQKLRWNINQALIESGDRDKILAHLTDLLHKSGWYEHVHDLCIKKLRDSTESSTDDLSSNGLKPSVNNYASLYQSVEAEAWNEIREDVKVEVLTEIKKVLDKMLVSKG